MLDKVNIFVVPWYVIVKIHPNFFKRTWLKNKNLHRHRLIWLHWSQRINNWSITNGEPHQLQKYRENIGRKRPIKYGWAGMDQINVHQTWTPVPRLEKNSGTDTIEFIFHKDKQKESKATYVRALYYIWPQKTETHRTRLTTWGTLIYYLDEGSNPTSDLTTMKLHVNSAILDVKPRYICMHVHKIFLLEQKYG